ncbi:hypothetical protein B0H63DRAFT_471777 [Podospora didyma]|uniref:VOC domain-containing protein n=1 Tax=Podospora didyma TaxID=330526 RepID=A0AAE0TZA0_9PEZI|nr:hypothetical protein B0H63DRAFT_471777 [Podospora didyma]
MITGLHHVNIIVPPGTLPAAQIFYGNTLGLTSRAVPQLQRDSLAWFDISSSGQQLHVAFGRPDVDFTPEARARRNHPCFRVESPGLLVELQKRIWEHFQAGGEGAPVECDEPGGESSGQFFFFFFSAYSLTRVGYILARGRVFVLLMLLGCVADKPIILRITRRPGCRIPDQVLCPGFCR